MLRALLLIATAAGLVSCSSSDQGEASVEPERTGANKMDISSGNNPFAFKKEDVNRGADGVVSGKRSMYDKKAESAYAAANSKTPSYLKKSYQKTAWRGGKNYSTGSFATSSYGESDKSSRFAGQSSRESTRVSRSSGVDYSTGSYRTGSANEAGRSIVKETNAYTERQTADGWGRSAPILSETEYRKMSMGQAKSLLGR